MVEDGEDGAGGGGEDALPPGAETAEQLALLPLDPPEHGRPDGQSAAPRRGPGRPPGAANHTTRAWRDYLLARYSSPLIAMAETYSMPVEDLAERLGCDRLEAFKLQQKAAADLAPYLHGRMPLAVHVDQRTVTLVVSDGGSPLRWTRRLKQREAVTALKSS